MKNSEMRPRATNHPYQTSVKTIIGILALLWVTTQAHSFYEMNWRTEFRGMKGWVVAAVTRVDGAFSDCKYDTAVLFENDMVFKCNHQIGSFSSFSSPSPASNPDAVIFVNVVEYKNMKVYQIKVLIGERIYDMQPEFAE